MPVSTHTGERFDKAKAELDEAREVFARAQSRLIEAERRYNDASRAWEHEFFGDARKREARATGGL